VSPTESAGHLAIGEVLTLLREDFPDVTISKIRFLESQGLIQPERTPSGYRKFFDSDIERLRWVLRQQKERFLPLKVIKERLESGEALSELDDAPAQASLFGGEAAPAGADHAQADRPRATPGRAAVAAPAPERTDTIPESPADNSAAWLTALQESAQQDSAQQDSAQPDPAQPDPAQPDSIDAGPVQSEPSRRRPPSRPVERALELDEDADSTRASAAELAEAAQLTEAQVGELVEFGILRAVVIGGEQTFDDAALGAARAASVFLSRGIEARHLRAYKLAAEREVGLFEQLILPLLRQRNPAARAQASQTLAELGDAGGELRRALLRQALRASLQGP
jgi:DNA-binding transcriptional MerR regulator